MLEGEREEERAWVKSFTVVAQGETRRQEMALPHFAHGKHVLTTCRQWDGFGGPEADLERAQAAGGEEAEVRRGAGRRSEPGDEARCLRQLEAPDVRLRRTQLAF